MMSDDPLSSAVKLGMLGGERLLTDRRTGGGDARSPVSHLLMMMSIEIASVLCHKVSQEAVDVCEQLNSTLMRLTMQTDAV